MSQGERDHERLLMPAARLAQNQPSQSTTSTETSDDLLAENDEPPDDQHTPRSAVWSSLVANHGPESPKFVKAAYISNSRKQSLLTALIHTSESDSNSTDEEDRHHSFASTRGLSTASISTASTAELTSDGGLTSPTRTASPSPPLPPLRFQGVAPIFKSPFTQPHPIIRLPETEHIGPLQVVPPVDETEQKVEAGLGRKRCITFACAGAKKPSPKPAAAPAVDHTKTPAQAEAPKPRRACALTFVCPNKVGADALDKKKAPLRRIASPAPSLLTRRLPSPGPCPRHRGSDATIRNESPESVRKTPTLTLRRRRWSVNSDVCKREATRFHEFAGSADEVDEWTEEQTCYRKRMTVDDTLDKENVLKRLAQEVEDEAMEEEDEEDEDIESEEDDEEENEDEDEDEDDNLSLAQKQSIEEEDSDDGFHSDNEDGFAASDDESDADSTYRFWTPGRSTAATSTDVLELTRRSRTRSNSDSSVNSQRKEAKPAATKSRKIKTSRKQRDEAEVDLPDSTDFVCGTFDEDRPKEMAYLANLQLRKAAMHIPRPQDIDPSFPESDPEMDEEDEVDDHEHGVIASDNDSDAHIFIHGQMDPHEDPERRGRRGPAVTTAAKRSPQASPRRLRSPPPPIKRGASNLHRSPPPPIKRGASNLHRSPPPPRKLFGQSPRRMRSPPPAARLRSPPPTRRASFQKVLRRAATDGPAAFDSGRLHLPPFASSLPRGSSQLALGASSSPRLRLNNDDDDDDNKNKNNGAEEGVAKPRDIRVRGAIDIVKGLEKKRERRRMKWYEKQCRKVALGLDPKPVKRCQPGKGAEKMREVGLEIAAYRGKGNGNAARMMMMMVPDGGEEGLMMLSY